MKPTDRSRDLASDLRLCEAATFGPWEANPITALEWGVWHIELHLCIASRRSVSKNDTVGLRKADAVFIAEARQGWPAAIRRALAAEAELAKLKGGD